MAVVVSYEGEAGSRRVHIEAEGYPAADSAPLDGETAWWAYITDENLIAFVLSNDELAATGKPQFASGVSPAD